MRSSPRANRLAAAIAAAALAATGAFAASLAAADPSPPPGVKLARTGANVLPDPVAEGGYYRFRTRTGQIREDDAGRNRQHSEFIWAKPAGFGVVGSTDRISFSEVYPSSFATPSGPGFNIVFQIHADAALGGGLSPPLTLRVLGSNIVVETRGGAGRPSPTTSTTTVARLERNVRYDWTIDVRWAQNATGFVTVYLNGRQVGRATGIATLHSESDHTGGIRGGLYHSGDYDSDVLVSTPFVERQPGAYSYSGPWALPTVSPYGNGGTAPARDWPLFGGATETGTSATSTGEQPYRPVCEPSCDERIADLRVERDELLADADARRTELDAARIETASLRARLDRVAAILAE